MRPRLMLKRRDVLSILTVTGTIFVLIGVGFASVRGRLFSGAEMATLGKFVVHLALPALVFRAVSSRALSDIAEPGYLLAVLIGSLAIFALGYAYARRIAGESAQVSTFRAMGMACANSGFVGYPVLMLTLPQVATTALALNMMVENVVMIPLGLILAERALGGAAKGRQLAGQIALRLARNPILIGLVLGVLASGAGVVVPQVLARAIDALAGASAALSLAVIGGTLAGLPMGEVNRAVLPVVAGKLVGHPLAVGLALMGLSALGLGVNTPDLAAAAVIMAAMPVMGIYPLLAQRYGEERRAALAMFAMTVLSFFTLNGVLVLMLP